MRPDPTAGTKIRIIGQKKKLKSCTGNTGNFFSNGKSAARPVDSILVLHQPHFDIGRTWTFDLQNAVIEETRCTVRGEGDIDIDGMSANVTSIYTEQGQ